MRDMWIRAARLCSALGFVWVLAGCGETPERALAREIGAGYDRSEVELRQGEAAVLHLQLSCTPDYEGNPPAIGISHRVSPDTGTIAVAPVGVEPVCDVSQPDGLFTGTTPMRLSIGAAAAPGVYRLSTRASRSKPDDEAFATIEVRVIAAQAPRRAVSFTASGLAQAVALAWSVDPADPYPAQSHRLERRGANGLFETLITLPADTLAHTDNGLQADAEYVYRLVPLNSSGSGPAATATARTPPSPSPRLFALQLSVDGSVPGRVFSQPAGLDCPGACRADFAEGSTVTLTAVPPAGGVVNWSGSAACSGSSPVLNLTIAADTFCRATLAATPPSVAPGWTSAGTARTLSALLGAPAIAFDALGEPTVAFVEQDASTERGTLRVLRRRGGLWQPVGADPVNAGGPPASASPALVLLDNGEPVVAWANQDGEMRASAWDGSAWITLGGGNLASAGRTTPASAPQLERGGGSLVAAWTESPSSGARIVLKRAALADITSPWAGGLVPGTTSTGGVQARLALGANGDATLLVLRTAINGQESPLRALEEASGWQAACGDLGSGGGIANSSVGFAIQRDRGRDGSAVVLRPSPDYRQVLGSRCVNGSWQPLGLAAGGVVAEVDNTARVLRQLALIPERGGRGPVALVAIDEGYRGATAYVQALLGDAGFEAAPGLERPRFAPMGTLGAGAIGAGALGFVQGFESLGRIELEVWRFAP